MNIIETQIPEANDLPALLSGNEISSDLLSDESRMVGHADFVFMPKSTLEVAAVMRWASKQELNVTISGGRTGIAGGAVPAGGVLLVLSKMQKISDTTDNANTVTCESGATLAELQNFLIRKKSPLFFSPDPTETSATIGGMTACNASGAHTFRYGAIRNYVKAITAVLYNGDIIKIRRGECHADSDGAFILRTANGKQIKAKVPLFPQPETKNAAGYYSGAGMDLIDLFIGSEGTLATLTEVELLLIKRPEVEFNAIFFPPNEASAITLTKILREQNNIDITAIEYFDRFALELLRTRRNEMGPASMVPPGLPDDPQTEGVYIDISANSNAVCNIVKILDGIAQDVAPDMTVWTAFDRDERERLRKFRHALPETVNNIIAKRRYAFPKITKLGTDMAVPDGFLSEILQVYRSELDASGLEYCMFGHIGNNHIHINILPRNYDEYALGKELYTKFANRVLEMKGSISAEHGIGKLKVKFLAMMLGREGIEEMKQVKKVFDPQKKLGTDTLFA